MKKRLMRPRIPRRGLLVLAALLVAVVAAPARGAFADPVKAGDFSVEGGAQGTDWAYDAQNQLLNILTGTEVTISMADGVEKTQTDRIAVADGIDANVVLDGVDVEFLDTTVARKSYTTLMIGAPGSDKGGNVRLTLAPGSVNRLRTTIADAVALASSGTLTIGGTGELDVESTDFSDQSYSQNGCAISANYGGHIVIEDGTINARAQGSAAAIGSSQGFFGGIRIVGGTVTATTVSSYNPGGQDYTSSAIGPGNMYARGSDGDISIEGGTVIAHAAGAYGGAAIGFYQVYPYAMETGPSKVLISGGKISAISDRGSVYAIYSQKNAVSITGGFFGAGKVSSAPGDDSHRGMAYDVAPDPGYTVIANDEPDSRSDYPVRVLKDDLYTLSATQDGPAVYDAEALGADAIALAGKGDVAIDPAALSDHATFRYRTQGSGGAWSDGLPKDAGTYEVEVSEGVFADGTGERALIPQGRTTVQITIGRRLLEVASATASPKAYDGGTDAVVSGVEFSGLVGGEHLWSGEDYTATGAFADAAAGQDKPVVVSVSLEQDGPRSRNYVLADGRATANTTAGILADGKDGKDGQNGQNGQNGEKGKDGRNGRDGTSSRGHRSGAAAGGRAVGRHGSKMPSTGDAGWIAGGAAAVLAASGAGFVVLSRRMRRPDR